ncbi:hypothetical protein [Roseibium alexandrii]|uniref:hypothetical protein n=1 Tax=Roseibium alexandrii TaxID=388408 RepID=UPI003750A22A
MTDQKNETERELPRPLTQPMVVFERLFNLVYLAHRQKRLFVIMDECEDKFHHRDIHRLTLIEQKTLYLLARDELARGAMKWGIEKEGKDPGSMQ